MFMNAQRKHYNVLKVTKIKNNRFFGMEVQVLNAETVASALSRNSFFFFFVFFGIVYFHFSKFH